MCSMSVDEIRHKYNQGARDYDRIDTISELLGMRYLRGRLLHDVTGEILEVAVGGGRNFRYYAPRAHVTAVDISRRMLDIAAERADQFGLDVTFSIMAAEYLAFPNDRFDAVVSSLSLCTFPQPVTALQEMARVCRPDGHIYLLEHRRSSWEWIGRWQDRGVDAHAQQFGCYWNREPLDLVRQAGLELVRKRRYLFGVFHVIEAVPTNETVTEDSLT